MKVLVTGAAGFLGGHVAAGMLEAGHEVTVYDLVSDDRPHLRGARRVRGDLLDPAALASACQGVDAVCHLGGVGDVILAAAEPARAAAANVVGTSHVVAAARACGVRRLVYASTWEVYGAPQYQPIDEAHPCAPDHPYNITKYAGERLALAADRLDDLSTVALRLGTAYGTRMRPNSVFSRFIDAARRGEPITIQGTGLQGRQFTHARDVARGFLLSLEAAARGVAINLVANETTTIADLAGMVTSRFPTDVRFVSARVGDVHPARVDATLAGRLLGWRAEVPFAAGLAELMDAAADGDGPAGGGPASGSSL